MIEVCAFRSSDHQPDAAELKNVIFGDNVKRCVVAGHPLYVYDF